MALNPPVRSRDMGLVVPRSAGGYGVHALYLRPHGTASATGDSPTQHHHLRAFPRGIPEGQHLRPLPVARSGRALADRCPDRHRRAPSVRPDRLGAPAGDGRGDSGPCRGGRGGRGCDVRGEAPCRGHGHGVGIGEGERDPLRGGASSAQRRGQQTPGPGTSLLGCNTRIPHDASGWRVSGPSPWRHGPRPGAGARRVSGTPGVRSLSAPCGAGAGRHDLWTPVAKEAAPDTNRQGHRGKAAALPPSTVTKHPVVASAVASHPNASATSRAVVSRRRRFCWK